MISKRIEARPGALWPAVLFALLGLWPLVWSVAAALPGEAAFAALPLAIAAALWLTRDRPFLADLTEEGLEVIEPPLTLPYHKITALQHGSARRAGQFAISVHHTRGELTIPARLNVSSRELFEFLNEQLPSRTDHPMPAALEAYRQKQSADFGPERVYCFRALRSAAIRTRRRRSVAVCLACAAAGVVWIIVGAALRQDYVVLLAYGIAMVPVSLFFALLFRFSNTAPRLSNWQDSGLVIGPLGLALVQGKMRGELTWDELRQIRYPIKPRFLSDASSRRRYGIGLIVEGATIVITDVYDRPLDVIHHRLRAYWEGEPDDADSAREP